MNYRAVVALMGIGLAACAAHLGAGAVASDKIFPIEYIAERSTSPRPVLGFFRDQFYQSYENRSQRERASSESRGTLRIIIEDGAYITDFVPIFVPTKQNMSVDRPTFRCIGSDQEGVFLIECVAIKSSRRFRSAYKQGIGFLWFEGLCYPEAERVCRYVPMEPKKHIFSHRMIESLQLP